MGLLIVTRPCKSTVILSVEEKNKHTHKYYTYTHAYKRVCTCMLIFHWQNNICIKSICWHSNPVLVRFECQSKQSYPSSRFSENDLKKLCCRDTGSLYELLPMLLTPLTFVLRPLNHPHRPTDTWLGRHGESAKTSSQLADSCF